VRAASWADGELRSHLTNLVELAGFQHSSCTDDGIRHLGGDDFQGLQGRRGAQRDLEDRQTTLHQGAGERHGVGGPSDGQYRHDGRKGRHGQNIHF
jgi:hypothetical protein